MCKTQRHLISSVCLFTVEPDTQLDILSVFLFSPRGTQGFRTRMVYLDCITCLRYILLVQNPRILVLPDMSGLLFVLILRLSDMHRAWMQIFLFFSLLIILFNLIWCICVCVLFLLTVNEVDYFCEQCFFQGSCSHGLLVMLLFCPFLV